MLQDDSSVLAATFSFEGDFNDPYDGPWKLGFDSFLPHIMRLLFLASHAEIDWSRGYEPLNTELQAILQNESGSGKRHADALYKVWRRDGREQWIVLHFEVQTQPDPDLPERMFTYMYRCFERYKTEVFGYAILGDRSPGYRPKAFTRQLGNARLHYEFECAKLLDYKVEDLEASDNPAALILLAHHYTWSTKHEQTHRRRFKLHLTRLLFQKGYSTKEVDGLFKVLDWMMRLGREESIIFTQEVLSLKEDPTMSAYVNTFEWVFTEQGIAKGLEKGIEQGIEKGIEKGKELGRQEGKELGRQEGKELGRQEGKELGRQEGKALGAARVLTSLLVRRFGDLPAWAHARLKDADADTLEQWSLRVLDAGRLEEVFA